MPVWHRRGDAAAHPEGVPGPGELRSTDVGAEVLHQQRGIR